MIAQNGFGLLRLPQNIFPVQENPSRGGFHQAGHHADGSGLAGPVRAQKSEDFPRRNLEGKVLNRMEISEIFTQMDKLDQ